jgi:hypothetical protein
MRVGRWVRFVFSFLSGGELFSAGLGSFRNFRWRSYAESLRLRDGVVTTGVSVFVFSFLCLFSFGRGDGRGCEAAIGWEYWGKTWGGYAIAEVGCSNARAAAGARDWILAKSSLVNASRWLR